MIKVSDYLVRRLTDYGVQHVFMVTGGGAMHLNDSFGQENRIRYICNHHEQACAMAAEGYAQVTGQLGLINVTSGPGGITALNRQISKGRKAFQGKCQTDELLTQMGQFQAIASDMRVLR